MSQHPSPSEKPNPATERPSCARCGEVIGAYERMILIEEGKPCKTSASAERDRDLQAGECYHAACYPA
jgi:hypothetical protein